MKDLTIRYTDTIGGGNTMEEIAAYLDTFRKEQIDQQPWPAYPYKPRAAVAVIHSGDYIFLQYDVSEKSIRAVQTAINSAVWEDSCVEFFIAFTDKGYYNFEFNCAGTSLLGFGQGKTGRELFPEEVVRKIRTYSVIGDKTNGTINWRLTVAIPVEVFLYDNLLSMEKVTGRANFYKCGDLLPEPHFLSWNNIEYPEPNFHISEYFGTVSFE